MKIVIFILLLLNFIVQIMFLISERNNTKFYVDKRLALNKNYYLAMDCVDNQMVSFLVDNLNDKKYRIDNIKEKGLYVYFNCENAELVFNVLTKSMKIIR